MTSDVAEERFWKLVDKSADCWMWMGTLRKGYGAFSLGGRRVPAHRFAYEATLGAIPDGLVLDHVCHSRDDACQGGQDCRHRACVNPAHLEPVTNRTNVLRGVSMVADSAKWTHCARGHPFDAENTYIHPLGKRVCKTCRRRREAAWKRERRRRKNSELATPRGDVLAEHAKPTVDRWTRRDDPDAFAERGDYDDTPNDEGDEQQ